jgi:hypothetical protein
VERFTIINSAQNSIFPIISENDENLKIEDAILDEDQISDQDQNENHDRETTENNDHPTTQSESNIDLSDSANIYKQKLWISLGIISIPLIFITISIIKKASKLKA